MLIREINSIYENPPTNSWRIHLYNSIKDDFELYIELLHQYANANYHYYATRIYSKRQSLFRSDCLEPEITDDCERLLQVDMELLHRIANALINQPDLLLLSPQKDKHFRVHWSFLISTLLGADKNGKHCFPVKVASAFAQHISEEDYSFTEYSNKQITIDDLL